MHKLIDPRFIDHASYYGLDGLLARQCGVIHRAQTIAAGMTRNEVDSKIRRGHWLRLYPGVYAIGAELDVLGRFWAVVLWAGPEARLAGGAALYTIGAAADVPRLIDVYVLEGRSHTDPPGIRRHRVPGGCVPSAWTRGLPITAPARAVLDSVRWGATDPLIPAMLRRGTVTLNSLQKTLHGMRRLPGYHRAAAAVAKAQQCPWSPPEQDLHQGLREAGVTGWQANARLTPGITSTGTVAPDIRFDDIKLAVEVEGKQFHGESVDPAAFEKDARRRQTLENDGWFMLRFTAKQIMTDLAGVVCTIIAKIVQLRALYGLPAPSFAARVGAA